MTNLQFFKVVCAGALIAGFFMPWVSISGCSVPGYKIPEMAGGFQQLGKILDGDGDPHMLVYYSPYIVPIFALLVMLNTLNGESAGSRALTLITGASPFVLFLYSLNEAGEKLFDILAIGSYWTLTAAAALLLTLLQSTEIRTTEVVKRRRSAELNGKIWGIVVFILAFLLILSLFSYDPRDRSLNTPSGSLTTSNWGGIAGAYLADLLLRGMGVSAYLLPLFLFVVSFQLFASKKWQSASDKIYAARSKKVELVERQEINDNQNLAVEKEHFCSQCGERVGEQDKFCAYCGARTS